MAPRVTFVGREPELRALLDISAHVAAGSSRAVVIEGPPGIGKTTLVRQWLADPVMAEFVVLRAWCRRAEADTPGGLVARLVARLEPARLARFPLLSLDATANSLDVGRQLLGALAELQSERPVVLLADDVRWADRTSVHALGYVLRRLGGRVLCAFVTEQEDSPGATGSGTEEIRRMVIGRPTSRVVPVPGLSAAEIAELTSTMTERRLTPGAAERVRVCTSGNPARVLAVLAGQSTQNGLAPPELTETLRLQLDALPPDARRLLDAAVVLEAPTPLVRVGEVADVTDVVAAVEPLLGAGLMRWWPGEPLTPVAVPSSLREAVLAAVDTRELRVLHERAAQHVASAVAWRHRVAAAWEPDPALVIELEDAAHGYLAGGAVTWAATLLLWASDLAGEAGERERHLLTAAAHLASVNEFTRVEALLPRVEASSPGPLRSLVLGSYAVYRGPLATADAELAAAFRGAPADGGEWIAAQAGAWLAMLKLRTDRGHEAIEIARETLRIEHAVHGVASTRTKVAYATACGFAEGPHAALKALRAVFTPTAATSHDPDDAAVALMWRGAWQTLDGQLTAGEHDLTTALRLAASPSAHVMKEFAYLHLANSQFVRGDWDESTRNAERALDIALTRDRWTVVPAHAVCAFVLSVRGEWARAAEHVRAAEHAAATIGGSYFAAAARALLSWARDDHEEVHAVLAPLFQQEHEATNARMYRAMWLPLHVEALIRRGDLDEAEAALDLLRTGRTRAAHLRTEEARLAGLLAEHRGQPHLALARYQDGVRLPATPDDAPLARALLEQACGRVLRQTGGHDEGLRWLRRAEDGLTALGAVPFLDRCRAESAAVRRDEGQPSGLGRLTQREQEVARLVSGGLTNNEIATRLFVTTKTVEFHLGNIYQRLGITNRRQLRDYVRAHSASNFTERAG